MTFPSYDKSRFKSTYSLLDLSLKGFDLALEFVNEVLKTFLVLPVLVSLEGQLLKAAISLTHVLLCFGMATLFAVKLSLEFTNLKLADKRCCQNIALIHKYHHCKTSFCT